MLRFIFCPNEKFNVNLYKHTKSLIKAKALTAALEERFFDPASLFNYIQSFGPETTPVIVLCDRYGDYPGTDLAIKTRMILRNAYLIYFSGNQDDLSVLTNAHALLSGYLDYKADPAVYNRVLRNIARAFSETAVPEDEKFTLVIGKQMQTFLLRDILYFESLNKKIYLNTHTTQISFYESLTDLQERLKHRFIRCHHSFLVNIRHIQRISFKDHEIQLTGKVNVKISETYKQQVLDFINRSKNETSP